MNIVIIEDEHYTAQDLVACIEQFRKEFKVVEISTSVKDALQYFKSHNDYQLIFSDIQLGDGLSFEIFKQVQIQSPVIFCTAYDNYAIEAFKANGIDYVLKPFDKKSIEDAIIKYERLTKPTEIINSELQQLLSLIKTSKKENQTASVLVHFKDKIIPIKFDDVAVFYLQNEVCRLLNFEEKTYVVNHTLDELEQLCSDSFFRANRQFLVNRNAVSELIQHFARKHLLKLKVNFTEPILVSKEKTPMLLKWLENG